MSPFPGRRRARPGPDDDPTQVLQAWREQQREERLADTREFPELLDTRPAATRPATRRRRVPLVLAAGVGALVVIGAVAVASEVDRPSSPSVVAPATTPAPSTSSSENSGSSSSGGDATAAPTPEDTDPAGGDDQAGPPGPPSGGPEAGGPEAGGPAADGPGGSGPDGGPADGGPGAGGPGGDAPAPPGR